MDYPCKLKIKIKGFQSHNEYKAERLIIVTYQKKGPLSCNDLLDNSESACLKILQVGLSREGRVGDLD